MLAVVASLTVALTMTVVFEQGYTDVARRVLLSIILMLFVGQRCKSVNLKSGFGIALSIPVGVMLPSWTLLWAEALLLVDELTEGDERVASFVVGSARLDYMAAPLLIVTIFRQVSLGFLGIAFLRQGQERKNGLLHVGERKLLAHGFVRVVVRPHADRRIALHATTRGDGERELLLSQDLFARGGAWRADSHLLPKERTGQ